MKNKKTYVFILILVLISLLSIFGFDVYKESKIEIKTLKTEIQTIKEENMSIKIENLNLKKELEEKKEVIIVEKVNEDGSYTKETKKTSSKNLKETKEQVLTTLDKSSKAQDLTKVESQDFKEETKKEKKSSGFWKGLALGVLGLGALGLCLKTGICIL